MFGGATEQRNMDKDQIAAAKARAAEVVNGFKRVTEQNARDAMKLVEALELRDRQISAMKKRMLADALTNASKYGKPKFSMDDFFKSIGL